MANTVYLKHTLIRSGMKHILPMQVEFEWSKEEVGEQICLMRWGYPPNHRPTPYHLLDIAQEDRPINQH
jgi:hypothetical protein